MASEDVQSQEATGTAAEASAEGGLAGEEGAGTVTAPHQPLGVDPHAAHGHPSPTTYVGVALILAVVTAVEVALYYVEGISDAANTISLIVLMVVKFVLVALWFMHLKFDQPLFRRLFVSGIVLAMTVYAVVLATFHVFPILV